MNQQKPRVVPTSNYKPPIFLCIILTNLFLLPQNSLSLLDPRYEDCIKPVYCGSQKITYPFFIRRNGDYRKKQYSCGYPGYEVSCENNQTLIIQLSQDDYVVRRIFYPNQSIQLVNSAFINKTDFVCKTPVHNLSVYDGRFRFAPHTQVLHLLWNCSNGDPGDLRIDRNRVTVVSCLNVNKFNESNDGKTDQCGTVTDVHYDGSVGEKDAPTDGLLERGILLQWSANNCSACDLSGGRCGYNKTISRFQCFCPDRPRPNRCHDRKPKKSKRKLPLILGLGIGGGAFIIIAIFVGLLFWKRHKLLSHANLAARNITYDCTRSELEDGSLCFGVAVFTYNELQESTNNFDTAKELGNGAFGTVYHGILKDGREVAVKRLYEKTYKRVEQFKNEVEILTHLRHPNLVSLYGCTSRHSRELLLVYEYVPNGTVADHLYGNRSTTGSLTWPIRMRIAIETASALSYLHHSDVIHRDVKTYNILLDHSFSVKVADFGLSRLFPTDMTHISTAPQGTPGYLDPEYHQCYHLTAKSDVYSFGVVLIELVSSLPAVDVNRHKHEINLSTYAMNRTQCCAFNELVDPQLGFDSDFKVKRMTILVAELAFQCLQHENELRPSMDEVLQALERIESADYEALKAQVMEESNDRMKQGESSTENDAVRLIRNVQRQSSPLSVMQNWKSSTFTTTNTSS